MTRMSTTTRRRLLATTAAGAFLLAACGTGTAGGPGAAAPRAVPAAAPAAAPAAPAQPADCADGLPPWASVAPGVGAGGLRAGARAQLLNRNRLVVGTSADVVLWGARNPFNGRLEGFDIELARRIAQELFGDPNAIEFRIINYAQRLPSVSDEVREGQQKSQPVDLVLHTMTINCTRWEQIDFSSEYYRAGQKILVRADDPAYLEKKTAMQITDLPEGSEICVPAGSTNVELLKADYQQYKPVEVPEIGECLVKFQRGEIAAITGDDTVLAGFAAQDRYAKVVGEALSIEPYGIGVRKDDKTLLRFVNAVLEETRTDGTWKRIYQNTMAKAFPPGTAVPEPPAAVDGRR
jgi:polar amino acid transport system substrate-binding protein